MNNNKNKAFIFDRDGTLNYRIVGNYIRKPEELLLIDDFIDLFPLVKEAGYLAIMATNQQGIGKGLMTVKQLSEVHEHLQEILIKKTGHAFDDIYFCYDLASSNSFYRKPNPGMLLTAINEWNIDPSVSWMIGDSTKDAIAGKKAGMNTMLIGNYPKDYCHEADQVFVDLYQAKEYFIDRKIL
jgi:D-glycero-D-manno-heptose 1,7-bisphosphate phosphatase